MTSVALGSNHEGDTFLHFFFMLIIFGLEQDLCVFLPQNRFQALLNEIIQQEEREMEQVKILFLFSFFFFSFFFSCAHAASFPQLSSPRLSLLARTYPAHSASCPLFTLIFMPNSKVQIQPCITECVSCYQQGPFCFVFFQFFLSVFMHRGHPLLSPARYLY